MKKLYLLALLIPFFFASCGSSKSTSKVYKTEKISKINNNTAEKVVKHAKTFKGTRYKFGGTSKSGMDCSGLVYTAFNKERIFMKRKFVVFPNVTMVTDYYNAIVHLVFSN